MMHPLGTVVVGVDGSRASDAALAWAADHLGEDGSLHIAHGFSAVDEFALSTVLQGRDATRAHAEKELLDASVQAARDHGVEHPAITFIDDDPADALITTCAEAGADVVVVGAHGDGATSHLLGSVTRKLIRKSEIPIIVVHPDDVPPTSRSRADDPFVLACVGPGDTSEQAACWAGRYAASVQLPLVLMHIVRFRPVFPRDSLTDMFASFFGRDAQNEWAKSDLDALADRIREQQPTVDLRSQVVHGRVASAIAEHADGADLVVIGRGRTEPLSRDLVGSLTRRIVSRTEAPIAIVPPSDS